MMEKPTIKVDADSKPYWDACAREELIYQFCTQCQKAQFYPRILCVHCGARDLEWRQSARRGAIYAITEIHVPGHPSFKPDVPYKVALIEMDEGFRIMTNILGDTSRAKIGDRGEIIFEIRGDGKLPQFHITVPAAGGS